MPLYEYECSACEKVWDEIEAASAPPLEVCPSCGKSAAKRNLGATSFRLKGKGWAKDGYSKVGASR